MNFIYVGLDRVKEETVTSLATACEVYNQSPVKLSAFAYDVKLTGLCV